MVTLNEAKIIPGMSLLWIIFGGLRFSPAL